MIGRDGCATNEISRSFLSRRRRGGSFKPPNNPSIEGRPLPLTTIEYDWLLSLARSAGRVKTREQLLLEVADRDFEAFDRSVDVHISSLRKKLGDDPKSPRYIETIRSVGYRMKKV